MNNNNLKPGELIEIKSFQEIPPIAWGNIVGCHYSILTPGTIGVILYVVDNDELNTQHLGQDIIWYKILIENQIMYVVQYFVKKLMGDTQNDA